MYRSHPGAVEQRYWKRTATLTLLVLCLPGSPASLSCVRAADKESAEDRTEAVAKSMSPKGWLLTREESGKKWQVVPQNGPLHAGQLILGVPGARLENEAGTVELLLTNDFDAARPVREPGVTLHKSSKVDLDFTLERGLVVFTNKKKKGEAHVRFRVGGKDWLATLDTPGAQVLLKLYTCWPAGSPFNHDPGPMDVPLAQLTVLVLEGEAAIKFQGAQWAMKAAPGLAQIQWDNLCGCDPSPQRLDKAPCWACAPENDEGRQRVQKMRAALKRYSTVIGKQGFEKAIEEFLKSDNPLERRAAIMTLAATDQLPRLGKVMRETHHADVWDSGILALRQWISRGPGQDEKLYKGLIDTKQFTPLEAETILQLLHSPGEEELKRPETYQMLIGYLGHDKLPIRALAYWHLYRLVPACRRLHYDPAAALAERRKMRDQWRNLIPSGTIPSREQEKGK